MAVPTWTSIVRDLIQALFFLVVGTVAVLTYLKAKKTLLQPIKTEIFKGQLQGFTDILRLFAGKKEIDLRDDFHFSKLIFVNTSAMYDYYAWLFFDVDFERARRPYSREECPESIFSLEDIEPCDGHVKEASRAQERTRPEPNLRGTTWSRYHFGPIYLPKEFCEAHAKLQRLMGSPLLPKPLLALLEEYLARIDRNVMLLGAVLTECAREMPDRYPTQTELRKAAFYWSDNRYNSRFESLEDQAKEISDYLRKYFSPDAIMEV